MEPKRSSLPGWFWPLLFLLLVGLLPVFGLLVLPGLLDPVDLDAAGDRVLAGVVQNGFQVGEDTRVRFSTDSDGTVTSVRLENEELRLRAGTREPLPSWVPAPEGLLRQDRTLLVDAPRTSLGAADFRLPADEAPALAAWRDRVIQSGFSPARPPPTPIGHWYRSGDRLVGGVSVTSPEGGRVLTIIWREGE